MSTPEIREATRAQLLGLARTAARAAHCPYSHFHVGAAALVDGRFFTGCNVENASYGLTLCAERNAIFGAVAAGRRRLQAIAVACPDAPADSPPAYSMPCGACRQVIAEFAGPDLPVLIDRVGTFRLDELLPHAFVLGLPEAAPAGESDAGARPRLCVDIDNVLAQSDPAMREVIRSFTDGRVNLTYADVRCFDYHECRDVHGQGITKDEWKLVHARFSEPAVLQGLELHPGARAGLERLAAAYELHLVTSRLPEARAATVTWLRAQGLPPHGLHFVSPREKHRLGAQFFAAIDDDRAQAEAFARAGTHSLVLAHPWNEVAEDSPLHRRASWDELTELLLELARLV